MCVDCVRLNEPALASATASGTSDASESSLSVSNNRISFDGFSLDVPAGIEMVHDKDNPLAMIVMYSTDDKPRSGVAILGKCRSIACMTDCGSICSRSVRVSGGTTCSNDAVCTGRAGANWPQDGVQ